MSVTLKKARRVLSTVSAFPTIPDRGASVPPVDPVDATGRCAIDISGLTLAKGLALVSLFGTGGDNTFFNVRFYGWYPTGHVSGDSVTDGYKALLLGEFLGVLCLQAPGISGGVVTDAQFYCDEIYQVGNSGNPGISSDVVSPGDNASPAHVTLNLKGCSYLEPVFSREGTGEDRAASCNALLGYF